MVEERSQQDEGVLVALRRGFWLVCLVLAALSIAFVVVVDKSTTADHVAGDIVRMEGLRIALQQVRFCLPALLQLLAVEIMMCLQSAMYHVEMSRVVASGIPCALTFGEVNSRLLVDLDKLRVVHDNLTVAYPPQSPHHVRSIYTNVVLVFSCYSVLVWPLQQQLYFDRVFDTYELYNGGAVVRPQGFVNMISEHLTQSTSHSLRAAVFAITDVCFSKLFSAPHRHF
jgi:hypothetical protein